MHRSLGTPRAHIRIDVAQAAVASASRGFARLSPGTSARIASTRGGTNVVRCEIDKSRLRGRRLASVRYNTPRRCRLGTANKEPPHRIAILTPHDPVSEGRWNFSFRWTVLGREARFPSDRLELPL